MIYELKRQVENRTLTQDYLCPSGKLTVLQKTYLLFNRDVPIK